MPKGVYDRSRVRPEAKASRTVAARDENWSKRERKIKGEVDYFALIPADEIPDDASYEWKRYSVAGKVEDQYLRVLQENGWTPVPHERHGYMPQTGENIVHDGQILMERPIELTLEARDEDRRAHSDQLRMGRERLSQAGANEMERRVQGVSVKSTAMPIPADDGNYEHVA